LAKFYTIKLVEISCVVIELFHLYRQTDRQSIFKCNLWDGNVPIWEITLFTSNSSIFCWKTNFVI